MELTVVEKDKYRVAIVSKKGDSEVTEFLDGLESCYDAHVDGLLGILKLVSINGLQNLTTELSKCVDKKQKIYEFRKGKLRLFYFKGEGDLLVICTSALVKKARKVDMTHVNKAIDLKKQYNNAVKQGSVILLESDE